MTADIRDDILSRAEERREMVERQLIARGVRDPAVIDAMRRTPRETFVDEIMSEFAYVDSALPIGEGQTISQPFIVARMIELAELKPGAKVLEIGTGSGYAAAVLAVIADQVFTIERRAALADEAQARFDALGLDNVSVRCGDGTLGWPEEAPFDAILVAAGAPKMPDSLKRQLQIGGRMVIPVGADGYQVLMQVRRDNEDSFSEVESGAVRFVPLIGAEGWGADRENAGPNDSAAASPAMTASPAPAAEPLAEEALGDAMRELIEPLGNIDGEEFAAAFDRAGEAKVVALGEATHGTSEFYRARAAATRRLVEQHGFTILALEADWPDAARIDRYVRRRPILDWKEPAFGRFPTWMWLNEEMLELIEWLREHNADLPPERQVSVHGLDLYALSASIDAVLTYLDGVDPEAAATARERYACLTPWQKDPAAYGRAVLSRGFVDCEAGALAALTDLLEKRIEYIARDGDDYLDAEGAAHLVAAAEEYFRTIYYADPKSWNLRDAHMFDTLERVRAARPGPAKAVIWAHNSHVGDARATEMGAVRGEVNIGQLCREAYGRDAVLIGFGTHAGKVMAARDWGGPGEVRVINPSRSGSFEQLCHEVGSPRFLLDLRQIAGSPVAAALDAPRLQRAIGVIYRPETEVISHYFDARPASQYDLFVWFDDTSPVEPLAATTGEGPAETFPFGV